MVDPISLALVSAGVSGQIAGVSTATIGAYAILGGAAVGGALIIRALSPKQHADDQLTVKQSIPPRTRAYGYCLLGGSYFFFAATAGTLVSGFALCEGPIDGIVGHWFNDNPSPNTNLQGATGMWPWEGQVLFHMQLGQPDQVRNSLISTYFPEWWTPAHRLQGIANTVVTCTTPDDPTKNFSKYFPSGAPSYLAQIRGALVFDPRDATQSAGDPTTWKWSENAAICILDYLTSSRGMHIPMTRIDLASFTTMANLCDEALQRPDGSFEPRYKLWGTYTLDEAPKDVLDRMLKTCDGEIYPTAAGQIGLRGGQWDEPTVVIDDSMILVCENAQRGTGTMEAFNELRIRYIDVNSDFQVVEGDPYDDVAAQAAAGQVLTQDFELAMVASYPQAVRLAKIFMAKGNPAWRLTLTTTIAGLQALGERTVTVNYAALGIDESFFVNGFSIGADGATCKITVGSLSADAYAYSASDLGNGAVTPTPVPSGPYVPPAPTGLALSLVRTQASGDVTVVQIAADITAPADATLTLHAQYRLQGASDWIDMSDSGQFAALSGLVADGSTYEVQVALTSFGGTDGPFVSDTIEVTADTTKPDAPTAFSGSIAAGKVTLTWTNSDSANAYATRVLRGSTLAGATLIATVYGGANAALSTTDTPGSGSVSYWIETINRSAVASNPTGPVTVTV